MSPSSQSPLEARLERVERALATISGEVASIRSALTSESDRANDPAPPAASAAPVTPPPQTLIAERPGARSSYQRAARAPKPRLDFESLLGRYGMLVIAVFAAVAAVGTFLSWAIGRGYLRLDPPARVLVGLTAAAALGVWGLRLRRRERSFGSSMVGLSLVIVQVCAYAAGPGFRLVPSWVAFAGVALLSWGLAIGAHVENDEPLWCVGFGGAAIAPFVTSNGSGNLYALLIYGLVVLLPACFAISHKEWPIAWRVFYLVSALFSLVGASMASSTTSTRFIAAFAFTFVIAAAGIVPFAPDSRKRAALRWQAILGTVTTFAAPYFATGQDAWTIAAVLVAAVALWLFLLDRQSFMPQSSLLLQADDNAQFLDWLDVAMISLAILARAVIVLRNTTDPMAVYVAAVVLFGAFAWRRAATPLRAAAAFATVASACAAVADTSLEWPLAKLTAFIVVALASFAAHKLRPTMSWLVAGAAILVFAGGVSMNAMVNRAKYTFPPFATEPSATALMVLAGFACAARFWPELRATLWPWLWAFLWGFIELSMAYSASTSTLLLVTYFAATAVACVGVGRFRNSAGLRQTGLALALAAAGTAFYGATTYFDFGARIAAYLVTSAFLLGIAYWYRRPGEAEGVASATASA